MGGGVIGWRTAGCGRCSGPRRSCAPAPAGGGVPNRSRSGSPPRRCGGMFSRPPAPELGLSPSLRGGGWPCSRGGGEGREAGGAVAAGAPAGLVVAPGLAPGLGLPRSNGDGEIPAGAAVAPGLGLPRSNGEGEIPAGTAVAPGGTRPGLPRGPGETGSLPPGAAGGLAPTAGGLPAVRAAARVGGGIFFGFSALIFCSTSALLETPFQPCSIFGCATLAFTAGGATLVGALVSLGGAPTMSLLPCTLVSVPDLAAADKSAAVCRSIVSR